MISIETWTAVRQRQSRQHSHNLVQQRLCVHCVMSAAAVGWLVCCYLFLSVIVCLIRSGTLVVVQLSQLFKGDARCNAH